MFGVYTHAQINSRLWAAVASWSTKRGAEYRKRLEDGNYIEVLLNCVVAVSSDLSNEATTCFLPLGPPLLRLTTEKLKT